MKKIIILMCLFSIFSFGEQYKITKNPNVKLEKSEMNEESLKLKKAINDFRKKQDEEKDRIMMRYNQNVNPEVKQKVAELSAQTADLNKKIRAKKILEIKDVKFLTNTKAEVFYNVKEPDIGEYLENIKFSKKIEEKITKKLGYKFDEKNMKKLTRAQIDELDRWFVSEFKSEVEKMLSSKNIYYLTTEYKIIFIKNKGNWEVEDFEELD